MNILEIIANKRDKKELSKEEIKYFVDEYVKNVLNELTACKIPVVEPETPSTPSEPEEDDDEKITSEEYGHEGHLRQRG